MPMMRGEATIGALSVARRRPGALSDKQKELLRTFASQAVIAIENTRLFNELRERTDDLTDRWSSKRRLRKCSRSSAARLGELEPYFNAMLDNAVRICEASSASWRFSTGRDVRAGRHA